MPDTKRLNQNTTETLDIRTVLYSLMEELLHTVPTEESSYMPFLEMGANSLTLMELIRSIEKIFGVKLAFRQFFEEITHLEALADYLESHVPGKKTSADNGVEPEPKEQEEQSERQLFNERNDKLRLSADMLKPINLEELPGELEGIFQTQLQLASQAMLDVITEQLNFLGQCGVDISDKIPSALMREGQDRGEDDVNLPDKIPSSSTTEVYEGGTHKAAQKDKPQSVLPFPKLQMGSQQAVKSGLTDKQQKHLDSLIERINKKTARSKQQTQEFRSVMADNRASAGFRFTNKEMLYPLIGKRGKGSRIWDIDGNEYVDIAMGFGVNFLGHNPDFVIEAIEKQLQEGIVIGPQSSTAGEVARLISELTGMERVTFCNSGTEAVMTALRLAKSATGRSKVAAFEGSYHGHFDGTLGISQDSNENPQAVPITTGVTPNMVADLILLDYGNFQSLDIIRKHGHELAAVLVEPVQSRRPDLQPKAFLQELRKLTEEHGIVLIFDEMITGFRAHPGGAQFLFNVRVDIATYGKVVGGGMPIGVVAGRALVMDGIDGGMWQYGDSSYPGAEMTFFAGTFCKHPLAMAAARAALIHLKTQGSALQEQLNQKTAIFAGILNNYFETEGLPVSIAYFASLFRFVFKGNLDLFFYHLLDKGVYTWEGPTCFLSTAHTDEDIAFIIQAVKDSIQELRNSGFLPEKPERTVKEIPLTEAQQQLWMLSKLSQNGSIAYHVYTGLELVGQLHPMALNEAVRLVVDRHEALRTLIDSRGRFQLIQPKVEVQVNVVDFSSVKDQKNMLANWLDSESKTPFNLETGPLFRISLVRLADDNHILVLAAHHIVVDGISMTIILKEIGAVYSSICRGQAAELPVPMQHSKYVEQHIKQLDSEEMKHHETHWIESLKDYISALELPYQRRRPLLITYRGKRKTRQLGPYRLLKQVSSKNGATLFMTLLAAYINLLYRMSGEDDIVVGIPVAGRPLEGYDNLVSYCTHLLAVRENINESMTFASYLKTLKTRLLEDYEHQEYPFARLINALNIPRDRSRPPLVSHVFNMDVASAESEFFDLKTTFYSIPLNFTPYDMMFNVTETNDSIVLDCDYNADLFEDSAIERFIHHYETLLSQIAVKSEIVIRELSLLTESEKQEIIKKYTNETSYYPEKSCIHHRFESQAAKNPNLVAVKYNEDSMTYTALNTKANQLARYLRKLGVHDEKMVGIFFDRSIELITGILGILKAGGAYVPLEPVYPKDRLAFMIQDAGLSMVLTTQEMAEQLPEIQVPVIALDKVWHEIENEQSANPNYPVDPLHPAYVIYTSGSTGKPKGVVVTHDNVFRLFRATKGYYNFTENDVWTLFHSSAFDFSVWEIWGALFYGGRLIIVPYMISRLSDEFYKLLSREQVTVLNQTPSAFRQLIRAEEEAGQMQLNLRLVIFGGEALDIQSLAPWFQRHGDKKPQLVNMYGITETTVHVTYRILGLDDLQNSGSIVGKSLPDLECYILDTNLEPVPLGVSGELCVAGAGLARGYLGRPVLTAERFVPNPFREGSRLYCSGDLARFLPDRDIEYLGRIDHQVKIRGFRIETGEIESLLLQYPGIRGCVVAAYDVQEDDRRLVGYVVQDANNSISTDNIRNFLKEKLPDYMVPSAFVVLDAMPLTPNGKINRKALPLPDFKGKSEKYAPPATAAEKTLASIWSSVVGIKQVGINDDFFDLGGHSLLIVKVQSRIRDIFKIELPLNQLFEVRTIAELSQVIINHEKSPGQVEKIAYLRQKVEQMSEEEVRAMLKRKKHISTHSRLNHS